MTSLEFIKKEIERRKESIRFWEKQLEERPYDRAFAFTNCLNTRKEELQTLFQIKCELEVLEILKPQLDLEYEDGEDDKFMIGMRHYVGLEPEQVCTVKEVMHND